MSVGVVVFFVKLLCILERTDSCWETASFTGTSIDEGNDDDNGSVN